jgi:hypothetical protein
MDGREFPQTPARPKPKEGMTMALKIKNPKSTKTDRKTKTTTGVKKLRVKSTAPKDANGLPVPPMPVAGWDKVDTSTEQTPKTEVSTVSGTSDVTVTLPFKRESGKYLEVVIGGNQAWLSRDSVTVIEQKDDEVHVRMTRAYARRRGLLLDQIAA